MIEKNFYDWSYRYMRNKKGVIIGVVIGILTAILYAFIAPIIYEKNVN